MRGLPYLRAAIERQPWAMTPDWLAALANVVERRASGEAITPEKFAEAAGKHSEIAKHTTILGQPVQNGASVGFEITDAGLQALTVVVERGDRGERRNGSQRAAGAAEGSVIAVISVMGVIAQHAHQVESISGPGGTSTQRVGESLDAAMADPAVKAVVFNVDSPGGNVHGVQELSDKMMGHRGKKPMIAQVNSSAGSAAYWIIANCDEIVVPPSGEVGSVGVYCLHRDVSGANEQKGERYTFIKATDSPYKVEGNPYEPMGAEALQYRQAQTDSYMRDFHSGIARGRGTTVARVKSDFGKGRMMRAQDAIKAGLADRIGTMEQTLQRVAKSPAQKLIRAADQTPETLALAFQSEAVEEHAGRAAADEGLITVEANRISRLETFDGSADVSDQAQEPAPPPPLSEQSPEERDAYRRRAFALRMRQS